MLTDVQFEHMASVPFAMFICLYHWDTTIISRSIVSTACDDS